MILSNTLVYDGHLQCGTQSIAHQRLSLPNYRALCRLLPEIQPWLAAAVDPEYDLLVVAAAADDVANTKPFQRVPVCFLNTDALPKRYEHAASNFAPNGQSALGGVSNKCEVKLVTKVRFLHPSHMLNDCLIARSFAHLCGVGPLKDRRHHSLSRSAEIHWV